jgi:hypothetical protein
MTNVRVFDSCSSVHGVLRIRTVTGKIITAGFGEAFEYLAMASMPMRRLASIFHPGRMVIFDPVG